MHNKLAGQSLPLDQMISTVLDGAKAKIAAVEKKDEKVKKLVDYEKKEHHGKIPTPAEEEKEKKSSILFDVDGVEKLAEALDEVGSELIKSAADQQNLGGEKKQGGETLPVGKPVAGTQSYAKDKAHHQPPTNPSDSSHASDGGKAPGLMESNEKKPPVPLNAKYPAKGVLKTAAEDSVKAKLEALKAKKEGKTETPPAKITKFEKKDDDKDDKKEDKEKKSSAVDFVMSKVSEYLGGGELTGEFPAEQGPKPSSDAKGGNDARKFIGSAKAAIDMKKVDGKKPQKRMLAEVLTEPALTKSTDAKVQENLRNAAKGGVKIAAARELLQKIAAEGCTCDSKGTCKYCKMQAAMKKSGKTKESLGTMTPMGGAPTPGTSSTPNTPAM